MPKLDKLQKRRKRLLQDYQLQLHDTLYLPHPSKLMGAIDSHQYLTLRDEVLMQKWEERRAKGLPHTQLPEVGLAAWREYQARILAESLSEK